MYFGYMNWITDHGLESSFVETRLGLGQQVLNFIPEYGVILGTWVLALAAIGSLFFNRKQVKASYEQTTAAIRQAQNVERQLIQTQFEAVEKEFLNAVKRIEDLAERIITGLTILTFNFGKGIDFTSVGKEAAEWAEGKATESDLLLKELFAVRDNEVNEIYSYYLSNYEDVGNNEDAIRWIREQYMRLHQTERNLAAYRHKLNTEIGLLKTYAARFDFEISLDIVN